MTFVEGALSTQFPGPQTSVTAITDGIHYVYRYYPLRNGAYNFLAVTSDNKVYVLGALTGDVLTQYGVLSDYFCTVYPQSCPATSVGPANATEAARFLAQATLGANKSDITALQSSSYAGWIDAQFVIPQAQSHFDWLKTKGFSDPSFSNSYAGLDNSIWRKLIGGNDPLRQKVTLALSEILVASAEGIAIRWRAFAVANYLDLLESNAFGNFRTLLEKVSLSPAMGVYLTYSGNVKANAVTGSQPDENYGRELMQLFTVGLQLLNPDGSLQLKNGAPEETYTQADVSGMARVWTGWALDTSGYVGPYGIDTVARPLVQVASRYETGSKTFLGVTIPAGTSAAQSLQIALDTVFNHPNTGPFICKQLIQRMVTSNPSSAYVSRIAAVFANNASGVRGDLKAVVKALLLDTEARNMANVSSSSFGKLREPIARFVNWARAYKATSASDAWIVGDLSDPASRLGQSPMRSTSVFNFFRPGYVPPGSDLSRQSFQAPEFQITSESSIAGYMNFMQKVLSGASLSDLKPDYSSVLALIADTTALLNELNLVFASNQIPQSTLDTLKTALDTIAVTTDSGKNNRMYAAILLVMAAPAYIAQK
ncbi:MAG: DUF1800 domain-containing protein [Candidatus Saccharibacteria bacterium]|nr:DUF1800 domain-containing protein [Rhodoferax sp.]